jgi:serine/threonine protein kinase
MAAESPKVQIETPHVARIISSDSIPAGGFTPGTILADRYRIIGLLGRGGMGEVYRADDLKLGQPVALKLLPQKLAEDPVRRERFFAEVRITRQLSHPNICRVYDIGEIDGRHFLSMEYIDGEDLSSLLKRIGHLTNEKALDIARQLAAGLAAAHERGVLHRDLKPANIMLDGHGRVRIRLEPGLGNPDLQTIRPCRSRERFWLCWTPKGVSLHCVRCRRRKPRIPKLL